MLVLAVGLLRWPILSEMDLPPLHLPPKPLLPLGCLADFSPNSCLSETLSLTSRIERLLQNSVLWRVGLHSQLSLILVWLACLSQRAETGLSTVVPVASAGEKSTINASEPEPAACGEAHGWPLPREAPSLPVLVTFLPLPLESDAGSSLPSQPAMPAPLSIHGAAA